MNRALPATGAALLVGAGLVVWWRRRGAPVEGFTAAPALVPDFGGPLGAELQRAHDNGWDLLFAASEHAHGLPAVDLLDEIAKGSPLGGPLPQWIVDRLNGGLA